jgi:hypothetical protein
LPREARVDQYAVRFPALVDGASVRVGFIREARITLDTGVAMPWSPVPCLTTADCFAEKLLANSDRWPDDAVLSRDLIDLAALRLRFGPAPATAWAKAEGAYHEAARRDLRMASARFTGSPEVRERPFAGLALAPDFGAGVIDCAARWAAGLE